jgi:hypothetical protein
MKKHAIAYMAAAVSLSAVIVAASPCQAQLLKQLEQGLLGGQGQGQQQGIMPGQQPGGMYGQQTGGMYGQQTGGMYGQQTGALFGQQSGNTLVGNVNLPPAQYMMTNLQTNEAFYVTVQNGQMFLSGQPGTPQAMAPGQMMQQQQGGMGGLMTGGLGKFLKNELQQQQQAPQQIPNQ